MTGKFIFGVILGIVLAFVGYTYLNICYLEPRGIVLAKSIVIIVGAVFVLIMGILAELLLEIILVGAFLVAFVFGIMMVINAIYVKVENPDAPLPIPLPESVFAKPMEVPPMPEPKKSYYETHKKEIY